MSNANRLAAGRVWRLRYCYTRHNGGQMWSGPPNARDGWLHFTQSKTGTEMYSPWRLVCCCSVPVLAIPLPYYRSPQTSKEDNMDNTTLLIIIVILLLIGGGWYGRGRWY
jgi:hypothetical protein